MLAMTVPDSLTLTCPCFLLQQAVHHPTLPVLAGECPLSAQEGSKAQLLVWLWEVEFGR